MHQRARGVAVVCILCAWSSLYADVTLPAVIGDRMVLQRDMHVPIWGRAEPGEDVTVAAGAASAAAKAGADGRWMVRLAPMPAGGPIDITVKGKNEIVLRDVLVGDVWVCSGQSNMQWTVGASANAAEEVAKAVHAGIRLFSVPRVVALEPLADVKAAWAVLSPETVRDFSAVGYFFGRDLHAALGVPVGLIHTSWGGTPAESWTTRATLDAYPEYRPLLEHWNKRVAEYPEAVQRHENAAAAWEEAAAKAKAEGKDAPARPRPPGNPHADPWYPGGLWNGMIAPLVPFAIQGAIWYQGESNADRAYQYRQLFPAMIRDWRQMWGQGDFSFFFVQLANFRAVNDAPVESDWAELREAQLMTLALPKTGMAVAIDIGEAGDIHPRNKQDVGRRLALAAQAVAHGKDVVYSGPIFDYMKVEGGAIRLFFAHTGGGLACKGEALKGFAIAGADRKFQWADARIDGATVVVSAQGVADPVAVRYAWSINPVCNLYNEEGLPASPFRTDSWPGVTAAKQSR